MRKLIVGLTAVAATAALPASANAKPEIPGTCDLIKNVYCHYLPPTSVEQACAFADDFSNGSVTCYITARQ